MTYNSVVRRVDLSRLVCGSAVCGYERGQYMTMPKGNHRLLTNELWEKMVEGLQEIRDFGCSEHAHKLAKRILMEVGEDNVK